MIFLKWAFYPVFLIFFLAGKPPALAQTPLAGYTFFLKYHYAFVMNHSYNMAHLANQRPMGIEAEAQFQTRGIKKWEQVHKYPAIGYSFLYMHMDRNKPLGDSYSLIAYYGKKFLFGKSTYFSYRFGFGAAYIERRFNLENNYQNNLISSRINYALNGRISFTWNVSSYWSLQTGVGLMHYSNGSMKVPNLGINLPSVHVGVSYTPHPVKEFIKDSIGLFRKYTEPTIVLAGGLKQVYPVGGPSYFASTLSAYVNRFVGRRSGLNLGIDFFFDASNRKILDTLQENGKTIQYFRCGIVGGHDFLLNKLSLLTQFGVYLYDPLHIDKPVYQRVAFRYRINRHWLAALSLKTHFGQADYVEWGLGYRF